MLTTSLEIVKGVVNWVNCLRKEFGRKIINLILKMTILCKVECRIILEKKSKKTKKKAQ